MAFHNKIAALRFVALLTVTGIAGTSYAQLSPNQFPCAECAVFDNNGNDLRGFINTNKIYTLNRGAKVNEYSGNTWGYLQIKNVHTPSVNKKGQLNYGGFINTTLALYKTADGAKATWWARQSNAPKGPLVYQKVEEKGRLDMENVRYAEVFHALEQKKMTLVEYANNEYNKEDYDMLFGNYLLAEQDAVKDLTDYKGIISFYNDFMSKFSSLSDPYLENKSFITFVTVNNTKYAGVFNITNSKLAGKLVVIDAVYEKDIEPTIKMLFKHVTGKAVIVYGDNLMGMEKAIIKYGRDKNMRLIRRATTDNRKFNDEK